MNNKESFLQYLKIEKRYSPHTVRSYLNDLDQFECSLKEAGHSGITSDVTSHDIRAWIVSMLDTGYSAVSVHRKISCLRVYFRYMRKEGMINTDPLQKIVVPKRKKSLPAFMKKRQ